jgi:hypothetical protein
VGLMSYLSVQGRMLSMLAYTDTCFDGVFLPTPIEQNRTEITDQVTFYLNKTAQIDVPVPDPRPVNVPPRKADKNKEILEPNRPGGITEVTIHQTTVQEGDIVITLSLVWYLIGAGTVVILIVVFAQCYCLYKIKKQNLETIG